MVRSYVAPEYDADYPQLAALGFDRPDEVMGNQDYLRIGDTAFNVDGGGIVTDLTVVEKTNNHTEDVLRTPGGIVMANGFSEKTVLIEVTYSKVQEIFGLPADYADLTIESRRKNLGNPEQVWGPDVEPNSLAAFIAQFKRTPIVPVVNNLLNSTHNITCLALEAFTLQTCTDEDGTPMPNVIKISIAAKAFAFHSMCPAIIDFDAAWIWPLQRWYWQQDYAVALPGEYRILAKDTPPPFPVLTPTEAVQVKPGTVIAFPRYPHTGMTGDFQFSTVSPSWIAQLESLRAEYNKLQAYALSDEFRSSFDTTARVNAYTNLTDLANIIYTLSSESYARMDVQDIGTDLILTNVMAQVGNNLTPLRIPEEEIPVYQHMSRGDVRLTCTFWALSEVALTNIQSMIRSTRELARHSRFELVAGFIGFENEISSLLGVKSVVFTDVQSRSVPGMPDNYIITIEMLAFDRTQRKIEAVQSSTNQVNYYLDQNPTTFTGETGVGVTDAQRVFWERYRQERDPSNDPTQPSEPINGIDSVGRPVNAWFNMAYIQQAKEQMAALELYPDLALPSWERLSSALQNEEIFSDSDSAERQAQYVIQEMRWKYWNQQGRFVDPDFFIDYPNSLLAAKLPVSSAGVDATHTSSYLANAISVVSGIDAITALHVDASIADGITNALFDTYGIPGSASGFYGPDLASNETEMSGEKGYPTGQTHLHGYLNMPHYENKTQSSVFASVFNESGYHQTGIQIDKKFYDADMPDGHPASLDFGHADPNHPTQVGSTRDPRQLIEGIPGYKDAYAQAVSDVKGQTPGFDPVMDLQSSVTAHHPIDIGSTIGDEHGRLIAMCHDMVTHDQTGRLIQAFPAYVMQLVDEGPRIGWVKIFPNFFALQSVQSIDIIDDRREPASTAIIELMNTYGNLSSYQQLQQSFNAAITLIGAGNTLVNKAGKIANDLAGGLFSSAQNIGQPSTQATQTLNRDVQNLWEGLEDAVNVFIPSKETIDNLTRQRRKQSSQIMLEPGVRVHLRLGYGSNGASFPVLFNGRITDIGHGERVRVICMSDGLELDKLIPSAESETNSINRPDNGVLQSGQLGRFLDQTYEPRELICQMLNSHGQEMYDYSIFTELWNKVKMDIRSATNGGAYADNPIGISHFGNPYLFNLWTAIAGTGVDNISPSITKYPQNLASYTAAKTIATNTPKTIMDQVLQHSQDSTNPFKIINQINSSLADLPGALTGQVVRAGDAIGNLPLNVGKVPGFAIKMVGEGASLLTHGIPVGYGETGENVYSIYCPFEVMSREVGSAVSHLGMDFLAGTKSTSTQEGDANIPGTPNMSTAGYTPFAGAGMPGTHFNMYTKNKTVWDVCTTMAQYFPPYICAVRPFEYRSTLFFGAPYFTYRYDYERITSTQLSNVNGAQYDKYYGYPVGYKTKPFAQFHLYTSKLNLIDNDIRASDEETYTDVLAMWYKGQGYTGGRPEPMPVHQTVDRAIAPAFKKTAIVNTDTLGFDTAPTAAAVIGSLGTAAVGYWVSKIGIPFTDISIGGGMNYYIAEENVRQMARAILRDYQKLMYQGHILVMGDPSVKPHDFMWINDDYLDIVGPASVRRVIHHFGFETGFVTSIEPDLACEVKGHIYMMSLLTQICGIAGTNAAMIIGSKILGAAARRKVVQSILSFGLETIKSQEIDPVNDLFAKTVGGRIGTIKSAIQFRLLGKNIKQYKPRLFTGAIRTVFINSISSLLQGSNGISNSFQKTVGINSTSFADIVASIKDAAVNTRAPLGAQALDHIGYQSLVAELDKTLAESFTEPKQRAIFRQAVLQNVVKSIGKQGITTYSAGILANRAATQGVVADVLSRVILKSRALITSAEVVETGATVKDILQGLAIVKNNAATIEEIAKAVKVAAPFFKIGVRVLAFTVAIDPFTLPFELVASFLWTAVSRWWDDDTSLMISFLKYRGNELQAGLNGHQDAIVLKNTDPSTDKTLTITVPQLEAYRKTGMFKLTPMAERTIVSANRQSTTTAPPPSSIDPTITGNPLTGQQQIGTNNPVTVALPKGTKYSVAQRQAIIAKHGPGRVYGDGALMTQELLYKVSDDVIGYLAALTNNNIYVAINAVWGCPGGAAACSHPTQDSATGPLGGHWGVPGRALDMGAVGTNSSDIVGISSVPALGKTVINVALGCAALGIGLDEYLNAGIFQEGHYGTSQIFRDGPGHIHVNF